MTEVQGRNRLGKNADGSPRRKSYYGLPEDLWLKMRTRDVTSTDVAALFDVSPYLTAFDLWHRKKGEIVVDSAPSDRMKWGNRLQDAIARGLAEEHAWVIRRKDEYMHDPQARIGASFDYEITNIAGQRVKGLLEIKNVDSLAFRDGWIVDGDYIEAPPHIELQAQHQLLVSEYDFVVIGALVGGNRVVTIKRLPDPKIIEAIRAQVKKFFESIDKNEPPQPDFSKDAKTIASLYRNATKGKVVDLASDDLAPALVEQYKKIADVEREAKAKKEEIKAQLLMKIGDAEKAVGVGFSITAGTVPAARIEAYERPEYRMFKINVQKKKEAAR